MIPVSNLDAAMLYAETPEMPMHTMGVLILEPENEPGADLDDVTWRSIGGRERQQEYENDKNGSAELSHQAAIPLSTSHCSTVRNCSLSWPHPPHGAKWPAAAST